VTRRQSNNQWSGGIAAHPAPQKIRVQKSTGKVLASIFWDQDSILHIDYLSKGQTMNTEYYSSLLVQLKDILKEKRRGKFTKGVLFFHAMPRLTGHLQPRISWPTLASNDLITHPILQIWPRRTTHVPWPEKRIKGLPFFVQLETWLDGQISDFIFSGLQKLEQRAKKCIELRGECVE